MRTGESIRVCFRRRTVTSEADWGVIWDMDGTLVDTAALHFAAWQELARELGRPFTWEDFWATFGQRNPEILRRLFGEQLSAAQLAALGARKEELYRAAARRGVPLLPGARALLAGLRAAGARQALGSSAPRANLDLILDLTGTRPYFDAVVSMEDTTRGKPDPQVFLLAAQRLGLPPARCLVLEDAPAGVQAAQAAGMKCVAIRGQRQDAESLRAAGAARVVASWEEVHPQMLLDLLRAAGDRDPSGNAPKPV